MALGLSRPVDGDEGDLFWILTGSDSGGGTGGDLASGGEEAVELGSIIGRALPLVLETAVEGRQRTSEDQAVDDGLVPVLRLVGVGAAEGDEMTTVGSEGRSG
jgi:hypothetical protein